MSAQSLSPAAVQQTGAKLEGQPTQQNPAASGQEVGEDEVLKVETTLVTVPVSVMDRDGKFIPGLRQEDFRIYEDGVEQEITFFAPVEKPFTVVLLIDTSGSTEKLQKEIRASAIAFLDQLRPEDNVMVATFDSEIEVLNKPTRDRASLRKAIGNITWVNRAGTYLYGTVDLLINRLLRRIPGRKALILFTDGVDARPMPITPEEMKRQGITSVTGITPCEEIPCATYESNVRDAEELDALIYPIQFDSLDFMLRQTSKKYHAVVHKEYALADTYMRELARVTGARHYRAGDAQTLAESFTLIAEELRRQYSLGYYSKATAVAGQRRQLSVTVKRPDLVVRARKSYIYNPPPNKGK
ncbi:MAG TPA: VWA domain-containing protein [Pyrinomonadaceae bacterium]|nr:VWA domain-containing protein [Pyrinomonadaceae bacterium]